MRLRLGLSHLNEQRVNHNFQNCINPLCTWSLEVKSKVYFLLHYHHYHNIRVKLLNSLEVIDTTLLKLSEEQLNKVLVCDFSQYDQKQNRNILNSSIEYIVESSVLKVLHLFIDYLLFLNISNKSNDIKY